MGDSDTQRLLEAVRHYQKSLERYVPAGETEKILHAISRLARLPIKMAHLELTGVGRTVNQLKKIGGDVGDAARALVDHWKEMVNSEQNEPGQVEEHKSMDVKNSVPDTPASPIYDSSGDHHGENSDSEVDQLQISSPKTSDDESSKKPNLSPKTSDDEGSKKPNLSPKSKEITSKKRKYSDSTDSEDSEGSSSEDSDREDKKYSKKLKNSHDKSEPKAPKRHKESSESEENSSSESESDSENSSDSEKYQSKSSKDSKRSKDNSDRRKSYKTSRKDSSDSDTSDEERHKKRLKSSSKDKDRSISKPGKKDSSDSFDEGKDRKGSRSSDKDKYTSSKHKKREETRDTNIKDRHTSDRDKLKLKSEDKKHSKSEDRGKKIEKTGSSSEEKDKRHKSSKENGKTIEKSHSSSSRTKVESKSKKEESKEKDRGREKDRKSDSKDSKDKRRDKESSSKDLSLSKDSKDKKRDKESSSKERNDKKEKEKSESSKKHSDKEKTKEKSHSDRDSSKNRDKDSKKSKSSSSPKKSDKDSKTKESSSKDKQKSKSSASPSKSKTLCITNGIDSESGASFADALGLLEPPRKVKKKISQVKEIDSESGTSFADALGTCEPSSSSKSSVKKNKTEKEDSGSSISKKEPEKVIEEKTVPKLLKEAKLEPLDIDVHALLPPPNYKPLGPPVEHNNHIVLNQGDLLNDMMNRQSLRRKIYSGNKNLTKVPTLFEVCVRVLQDNIDALEFTGGVPYHILKPILEKANPDQLYMLEHHNPYFIEDTDELWQLHCQKEFKNKKREELESWREMYMRCLDEREMKLKALTANIKQSQDKSLPVRTTKMAFVDDYVKPPRNILRKQTKNGTSQSDRVAAPVKKKEPSTIEEAKKISVPSPVQRSAERSSSSHQKPKKAPLMAKLLSSMKGSKFPFGRR